MTNAIQRDPDGTLRSGLHLLARHDLGGHGDTMHVNVVNGIAYVGHQGDDRVGTSILDVSDPRHPELLAQITTPPGTHSHKVQVVGDVLVVNHERNLLERDATSWSAGIAIYDVSDPARPQQISFLPTPGKGVHRMTYWAEPYIFITGSDNGYTDQLLIIADLSDPSAPTEVGRWHLPGMHSAAGEIPDWAPGRVMKLHHALVRGDRAYAGWWDGGLVILDVSDVRSPHLVSRLEFPAELSRATHTALPLPERDLLVVTDECVVAGPGRADVEQRIRLVDISDETAPAVVGQFPLLDPAFHDGPGRCGPHNLHEMRPGTFRSSRTVHATYFNAGLRVFDVDDPTNPVEIASFVPPAAPGSAAIQFNDLTVTADGLVYVTDRAGGGLYIVEPEIDFP